MLKYACVYILRNNRVRLSYIGNAYELRFPVNRSGFKFGVLGELVSFKVYLAQLSGLKTLLLSNPTRHCVVVNLGKARRTRLQLIQNKHL